MKARSAAFPYLIWMGLFIIIPLGLIAFYAFTDKNAAFTLENILSVGNYGGVLFKSIYLAAISTVICLIIGYPLAYALSRLPEHMQNFCLMLVMLPMWINFLLRTYAWMTILEDNGLINSLLVSLGLPKINLIDTQGAVVLGMIYNYLPFMITPLYSVLTKVGPSLTEAAQDLGASPLHVFLRVIFPLSMPGVTSGVTMVFVPAVSTFIISKMLGGSDNLLIGDIIDMKFLGNSYNPYLGSAISLMLMVVVLICMGLMNQFDDGDKEGMLV